MKQTRTSEKGKDDQGKPKEDPYKERVFVENKQDRKQEEDPYKERVFAENKQGREEVVTKKKI